MFLYASKKYTEKLTSKINKKVNGRVYGKSLSAKADKKIMIGFSVMAMILAVLMSGCKFQPGWGYNKGYSPEQPIPFDHSLHVGKNQIQCTYCHNQVERSRHSTIPALSTCMNCHLTVKTDSPYIQKLAEAYMSNKPIEWVKVHMLPDHVQFNHSIHITKGLNCQTCHGEIEKMSRVEQFSDLSMGWCVNCHRQPEHNAPINCTTCHH